MWKKRFNAEQIVAKLRKMEVLTSGGKALGQARKETRVAEVTC